MGSGTKPGMSDKEQKAAEAKRISERDRFKFIGFDVFPGEPKELFNSEAEKNKLVQEVRAKREHHDHLRESCTLIEERVSGTDRIVLTIASVIIVLALILPWYSAYNEIVEETKPTAAVEETATPAESLNVPAATDSAQVAATPQQPSDTVSQGTEQLITAFAAKKKIHKEYSRLSGIGAIISIGTIGSYVFSSGIALILAAILFLVYTLLCIGIPIYTLYGLYGLKGSSDSKALKLKSMLRLNWIPLVIFVLGLVLSFFGSDYSFDAPNVFTSIGSGFNAMAYLGTLSWGVFVSLGAFILCAAKGAEI